jgi:hypothetical protein
MKSNLRLLASEQRSVVVAGLLALAAALPATSAADANETYTWSAELVAVDEGAGAVTVQSRLVGDADVDFDTLESGDRVTLTWSGINTAAGVRRIVDGDAAADERLTLPIEFVSAEHDNQYVRFKVIVPREDLTELASLQPGTWITATSPRRPESFEGAVADARPYNDVP